MLSYYTGGNVKETRRSKAQALRDIDRENIDKKRRKVAELGLVTKATRSEKRTAVKKVVTDCAAEEQRIKDELQAHKLACGKRKASTQLYYDEKIDDLRGKQEEIRGELRSSRAAGQANRSREKERASRSTAKERREESEEQVENDIRHHLGEQWIAVWRRVKHGFRGTDRMTPYEQFAHYAHETPEALEHAQAQATVIREADIVCGQAQEYARQGDAEAAQWAAENCDGDTTKRPPKGKKSSAASRTLSLLGDIAPPKEERKARKTTPKRGKRALREQGSLTVGSMGAVDLVNADADQIPF